MTRLLSFLILSMLLTSSVLFAQNAKLNDVKMMEAPKFVTGLDDQPSFYTDFKNRQIKVNRVNKGTLAAPMDLIVENWDWPSNQFTPPHSFMFDILGDGTLYPLTIETGNTLLNAAGAAERYNVFAFADDLGVATFLPYGFNTTGNPIRCGWNSHLILDKENGKCYLSIYDFLNNNVINNHLWVVDLLDDPSVATQLTNSSTALEGGWPRIALDGNGTFWMTLDLGAKLGCGIAVSVDGGQTFNLIDSVGSNDPSFWATAFGNDFGLMASPEAEKISFFTKATRGGSLAGLGIPVTTTTSNRDSASGVYHWYSADGGNSWTGEWVMLEGDPVIVGRPNYQPAFISYSTASYVVDPNGVTHFVMGVGPNSAGIVGADTINVYPVLYWNDVDKDWLPLEIEAVEHTFHDATTGGLGWGNIPAARPIVKTDPSGQVVVAMWNRLQFSGAPGASSVNIYSAAGSTDQYHYDVVYAYSEDFGATWSEPMIAARNENNSSVYPIIADVETEGTNATVHFTYLWDKIPGSFVIGQNAKSVDNAYIYDTVEFTLTNPVSVDGSDIIISDFRLEQNYPNPFNPSTTIKYRVAERSNVSIKVYDMLGKEITTLVNTIKDAGAYEVNFDASNLASGMYVYSITAGNFTSSKKMMLLK
jgi:hypothetical protein